MAGSKVESRCGWNVGSPGEGDKGESPKSKIETGYVRLYGSG